MAQILKEELRKQILEAGKQEFLQKGYDDASLRDIAKKAHTTVGNLYRYFRNKEDINKQIVEPCLLSLEKLINDRTSNQLSIFSVNKDFNLDKESMLIAVDNIIDEVIDIYNEYNIEFKILMMDYKLTNDLKDWFTILVGNLIKNNYKSFKGESIINSMAVSYSCAILAGFIELLKNDFTSETMKLLSKNYFRSYVYMLNSDIDEMIEVAKEDI